MMGIYDLLIICGEVPDKIWISERLAVPWTDCKNYGNDPMYPGQCIDCYAEFEFHKFNT